MNEDQQGLQFNHRKEKFGNEDEIELMEILRVIWRYKLLIILGTLFCTLFSIFLSYTMPKIYLAKMIIQPGVISAGIGKKVMYADEPANLQTLVQKDVLIKEIQKSIDISNAKNNVPLKFSVNSPKRSDLLVITYETTKPPQGVKVLKALYAVLTNYYSDLKNKYDSEYESEILTLKENILALDEVENVTKESIANLIHLESQITNDFNQLNDNKHQFEKDHRYLQLKNELNKQIIEITKEKRTAKSELIQTRENKKIMIGKMKYLENSRSKIQMVKLVKPPTVTSSPVKPNIKLNMSLATGAGFFLMILISFFLEYLKNYQKKKFEKND